MGGKCCLLFFPKQPQDKVKIMCIVIMDYVDESDVEVYHHEAYTVNDLIFSSKKNSVEHQLYMI